MNYYVYNPLTRNKTGYDNIKDYQLESLYNCTIESEMIELQNRLQPNDIIYVIGGDGTLRYLLNHYNHLFSYDIRYYRNGSGNDFYRSLKDNKNSYYYTINDKYNFINSFGVGFDALICEKVNSKMNKTKLSYIIEAYKSLKEYQPIDLEIYYNGKNHHYKNIWLCSLQNGNYFGGGLKIAQNADITDEKLDLCIAHDLNRFTVLLLLLFVKLGIIHLFKKYFFTVKVESLVIKNTEPLLTQLDGDTVVIDDSISLTDKHDISIRKVEKLC